MANNKCRIPRQDFNSAPTGAELRAFAQSAIMPEFGAISRNPDYRTNGILNPTKVKLAVIDLFQTLGAKYEPSEYQYISDAVDLILTAMPPLKSILPPGRVKTLLTIKGSAEKVSEKVFTSNILDDGDSDYDAVDFFLKNAFGSAVAAKDRLERKMTNVVISSFIINRSKGTIVSTIEQANQNIEQHKKNLLKDIQQYFIKHDIKSGLVSEDLDTASVKTIISKYNKQISELLQVGMIEETELQSLHDSAFNMQLSEEERARARTKIDAYGSWLALQHFDNFVKMTLGDTIIINPSSPERYSYSTKGTNMNTTWRKDNIDLQAEINKLTQALINSSPMFTFQSTTPMSDAYMEFSDFSYMTAKIKDLVYDPTSATIFFSKEQNSEIWNTLTEDEKRLVAHKSFRHIISNSRYNPQKYLPLIYKILVSGNTSTGFFVDRFTNFHKQDKNILWSMFKNIYDTTVVEGEAASGIYSLHSIQKANPNSKNYFAAVSSVADCIFSVDFAYYTFEDGVLRLRSLRDAAVDKTRREIENIINNKNSQVLTQNFDFTPYNIKELDKDGNESTIPSELSGITFQLDISKTENPEYLYIHVLDMGEKVKVSKHRDLSAPGIDDFRDFNDNIKILQFFDEVLGLNFAQNSELRTAYKELTTTRVGNIVDSVNPYLKEMFAFAGHIFFNRYFAKKYLHDKETRAEKRSAIAQHFKTDDATRPRFNNHFFNMEMIPRKKYGILLNLAQALGTTRGLNSSRQVRDSENAALSSQTLSRLLGNMVQQMDIQINAYNTLRSLESELVQLQEKKATASMPALIREYDAQIQKKQAEIEEFKRSSCLLNTTQNPAASHFDVITKPGLFQGVIKSEEIKGLYGSKKQVKFTTSEAIMSSFIHNFVLGHCDKTTLESKSEFGDGMIGLLPSVNSDKTTVSIAKFNLKTEVTITSGGNTYTKSYMNLTNQELMSVIAEQIGTFYNKLYDNVKEDFSKLLPTIAKYNQEHGLNLPELNPDTNFAEFNSYIEDYNATLPEGSKKLKATTILQELITDYNTINTTKPIRLIDQIHYISNSNGSIKFNNTIKALKHRFSNPEATKEFFDLKSTEVLKSVLGSGFSLNLYGNANLEQQPEIAYLRKDEYKNWVNLSGKMVIAKVTVNDKVYDITSNNDLKILERELGVSNLFNNIHALAGKVQLHPMLEKYNLMDYLFTQQFMYSTVGSHVAHPAKAKIKTPVIWAHPGIGKTHLIEDGTYSHRFMDWDVEFNRRRDSWIAQHSNTEIGTPEFKEARSYYQMNWRIIPEYEAFVKREWARIKQKAQDENKILVASPHMLLELFADEFSSVLTMSKEAFITRSMRRGDSDPSGWKTDLDITISSLMANPVFASKVKQIKDTEYLTSLVESGQLRKELNLLRDNEMAEEASRFYAQHKRNVSFTAAMDQFQLNQKDGIPTWYNIAVIKDIKQNLFTVDGHTNDAKPYDGATFVNPFIVYLENFSLNEARAGIDKKQFVHYYDELTGTGGIIKTAGFGVTNDRMRNSEFYRDVMKNMTSRKWRTEKGELYYGDITKDFNGNEIDYGTFYFKKGSKYYKAHITAEVKQITDENGNIVSRPVYYRHATEISINGEIKGTAEISEQFLIDNNYDLWQLFGGMHSQEFNGDSLEPSETSIKNVVKAMNEHGIKKSGWSESDITAEFIEQPLKNSDIHYMPTEGAVKQGIANINPNTHYRGSHELSSFRIRMTNAGIQLDKEHHADGSKLSLMTQVISAACSMGYTPAAQKKLYTALYKLTLQGVKPFITSFEKLLKPSNEMDKTAFEVAIAECMVRNMVTSTAQDGDMLRAIATDLIAKVRYGGKLTAEDAKTIAYSESTVFGKLVATLSSIMTKSGIKAKMDGILSVLCPTQGIVKMYDFVDGDGVRHSLTLSQLEAKFAHLYTDTDTDETFLQKVLDTIQSYQKPITSNQVTVGKKYAIKFADRIDSSGNVIEGKEIVVDVTYPHDTGSIKGSHGENVGYQAIKNLVKNGHAVYGTVETIHEYVKEGNDLKAVNYTFNDLSGNSYQVWDIDFIQDLFEIVKVTSDMESIDDKITSYENLIRKYDGGTLEKFEEAAAINYTTYQNQGNINEELFKTHRLRLLKRYAKQLQQNILFALSKNNPDKTFPVKIEGKDVTIDKASVKIDAYELVMPKVFLEEFGLDNYTNLDEIVHNKDYFYDRMVTNFDTKVLDETHYDVELKVTNGKHIYLKDRSGLSGNWSEDLEKVTIHKYVDELGQVWRMDLVTGKKMYQLFNENDEVYRIPETGVEIILTSTDKVTDSEGNSSIESGISHYLDTFKYQSLHISSAIAAGKNPRLSKNNRPKFENLLEIIQKSENKCAQSWIKLFKDRKKKDTWVENMVELNEELNDFNRLGSSLRRYLKKQAAAMHTSLLKSLDVIAARIPAQNQQSFMPMKVVAFDNPNINTAYVSVMQFFLQGSDLDIDAVSLLTFSFSPNGEFYAWSPDFDMQNMEMLNLSTSIPFPTGNDLNVVNYATIEPEVNMADRMPLLNENEHYIALLQEYERINNLTDEERALIKTNPEAQELEYQANKEALKHYIALLEFINDNDGSVYFDSVEIESSDFSKQLIKRINKHNKYLLKAGDKVAEGATKNYVVGSLYSIATDPANWLEAHTGVDIATGPLKAIANKSELSKVQQTFTPGNVFNKFQAIEEASVGKDDIAICATGLKGFFAATQFSNDHLNRTIQDSSLDEKTIDTLASVVTFNPVTIGGKTFTSLANIRVDNLEKVNPNSKIYNILRNRGFDEDASVIMSALLSLSTDNAKDLALAKINAGTGMISLYLYGAAIGMDFQILNKIIASPLGFTVAKLLNSDEFSYKQGKLSVDSALTYLTQGPTYKDLKQFDGVIHMGDRDLRVFETVNSVLKALSTSDEIINKGKDEVKNERALRFKNSVKDLFNVATDEELSGILGLDEEHPELTVATIGRFIARIVANDKNTNNASAFVSLLRNAFNERVDNWAMKQKRGFQALGNQMFDFLNEFVDQTITLHNTDYETEYGISNVTADLNKLALGADEFKRLGQFLRLNQEIKTKPDELIGFAQKMETLLKDRVKIIKNTIARIGPEHLGISDTDIFKGITNFDFKMFAESFIEDQGPDSYYQQQIDTYEQVCKSCINPLRILTSVDHYKGYFTSMILAYEGDYTKSIKFRTIKHLGHQFMEYAKISKPAEKVEVYKNVQTFVDDYINNAYLRSRATIILPQKSEKYDVKIIDAFGIELDNTAQETEIQLGTEPGNATLEHFFENIFIPKLKELYPNNKFVQELTSVLITDPITKAHLAATTLPINMMPSSDNERILFNKYKNDFNKISGQLVTIDGIPYSILDMFHYYNLIKFKGKVGRSSLARIFEDKVSRHETFVEYRSFINSFDENYDFIINPDSIKDAGELSEIVSDKSIIPVDIEVLATYLAPTANYRIASAKLIKYNDLDTGKMVLLKKKEKQDTSETNSGSVLDEELEQAGLLEEGMGYEDADSDEESNMIEGLDLGEGEENVTTKEINYESYELLDGVGVLERFNSPSIQTVETLDYPIASYTLDGNTYTNLIISGGVLKQFVYNGKMVKIDSEVPVIKRVMSELTTVYQIDKETLNSIIEQSQC